MDRTKGQPDRGLQRAFRFPADMTTTSSASSPMFGQSPRSGTNSSRLKLSSVRQFETINDKVLKEMNERAKRLVTKRKLSDGSEEDDGNEEQVAELNESCTHIRHSSSASKAANAISKVRSSPTMTRRKTHKRFSSIHRREFSKMDSIASHYKVKVGAPNTSSTANSSHADIPTPTNVLDVKVHKNINAPSPLKKRRIEQPISATKPAVSDKENSNPAISRTRKFVDLRSRFRSPGGAVVFPVTHPEPSPSSHTASITLASASATSAPSPAPASASKPVNTTSRIPSHNRLLRHSASTRNLKSASSVPSSIPQSPSLRSLSSNYHHFASSTLSSQAKTDRLMRSKLVSASSPNLKLLRKPS